jgi:hypothetical protein
MPVIIALERLRQEVYKFEASLGYIVSSCRPEACLKKTKQTEINKHPFGSDMCLTLHTGMLITEGLCDT